MNGERASSLQLEGFGVQHGFVERCLTARNAQLAGGVGVADVARELPWPARWSRQHSRRDAETHRR